MKKISFKVNRKLELNLPNKEKAITLIQEVNEKYFLVTIPLNRNNRVLLSPGDTVEAVYYSGSGAVGFLTTVIGRTKDKIPVYKISPPRNVYKVERRNFFRIDLSNDIAYSKSSNLLDSDIEDIQNIIDTGRYTSHFRTGYCVNLSGGGSRIVTEEPLNENDTIVIHLQDTTIDIITKARVIRSDRIPSNNQSLYESALEFVDISEKNREKIISYIFEKVRKRRRESLSEER